MLVFFWVGGSGYHNSQMSNFFRCRRKKKKGKSEWRLRNPRGNQWWISMPVCTKLVFLSFCFCLFVCLFVFHILLILFLATKNIFPVIDSKSSSVETKKWRLLLSAFRVFWVVWLPVSISLLNLGYLNLLYFLALLVSWYQVIWWWLLYFVSNQIVDVALLASQIQKVQSFGRLVPAW